MTNKKSIVPTNVPSIDRPSHVGPKGTFKMATIGASLVDDEPTPIDPPSFDLHEVEALLHGANENSGERKTSQARHASPGAQDAQRDLSHGRSLRLKAGDRVGHYLVMRLINRGGMAEVYEVMHTELDRIFALKILSERYKAHELVIERFRAEAKVLLSCRANPNVCELHEVGDDPQLGFYIVMERLKGPTLRQKLDEFILQNKRIDLEQGVGLTLVLADALDSLHRIGVIHRDVKPENIMLEPKDTGGFRFVIIDFGIAKSSHGPSTTQEGQGIGSWLYASPEQARKRRPTAASDQYSLAHVLYEVLFEHAFAHAIRDQGDQLDLIIGWQVLAPIDPPPAHLVPPSLFAIIERALRKDPNERFPSMRDFAAALRAFLLSPDAKLPAPKKQLPRRATVPSSHARQAHPTGRPEAQPLNEVRRPHPKVLLNELCKEATLFIPNTGRFLLGQEEGIVGGDPDNVDIAVNDPSVTGRHCRFRYITGGAHSPIYLFEDLGSLNGMEIRGLPTKHGTITRYEQIRLGDAVAILYPAGLFVERNGKLTFAPAAEPVEPPVQFNETPPIHLLPGISAARSELAPQSAPTAPLPGGVSATPLNTLAQQMSLEAVERGMNRVREQHRLPSVAPSPLAAAPSLPQALPQRPIVRSHTRLQRQIVVVLLTIAVVIALAAVIGLVSGAFGRWTDDVTKPEKSGVLR